MIITIGSKETDQIWNGIRQQKIPPEIQKTGRRKLRMINNSIDLNDLEDEIQTKNIGFQKIRRREDHAA